MFFAPVIFVDRLLKSFKFLLRIWENGEPSTFSSIFSVHKNVQIAFHPIELTEQCCTIPQGFSAIQKIYLVSHDHYRKDLLSKTPKRKRKEKPCSTLNKKTNRHATTKQDYHLHHHHRPTAKKSPISLIFCANFRANFCRSCLSFPSKKTAIPLRLRLVTFIRLSLGAHRVSDRGWKGPALENWTAAFSEDKDGAPPVIC